ncbi:MAG: holo-ACP synthase [Nitrospinota bacterium]|nr:holo-ACP synthase [Nitrospinota bacterium]
MSYNNFNRYETAQPEDTSMIHGTGVDLIEISRIKNSIQKYSGKFEERVFTSKEIDYCRSKADPFKHFAARFAAKEAVLKSLGTGMAEGISWKDMEILNQESGRPVLHLSGKGRDIFDSLNLRNIHISMTHDKQYAVAQAVAELN